MTRVSKNPAEYLGIVDTGEREDELTNSPAASTADLDV